MKGDFSRVSSNAGKQYSSVRWQQGRVLHDADLNEWVDIQLHRRRTVVRDLIGPAGGPQGNAGFKIEVSADGKELTATAGHYYVDGVLVENREGLVVDPPEGGGTYRVYLDVWERHITALEDPDLLEPALGGPDTTTRTQVAARVELEALGNAGGNLPCPAPDDPGANDWMPKSTGRLAARAQPGEDNTPGSDRPGASQDVADGKCLLPPRAGYRGLENQLYRVEIHRGGSETVATFKWSRENGSVATRWTDITGSTLTVESLGRDGKLGFKVDDWVELSDEARLSAGQAGLLTKVKSVTGDSLTVHAGANDLGELSKNAGIVRRWEGTSEVKAAVAAKAVRTDRGAAYPHPGENKWRELEDGVQVLFTKGEYQSGDYWLVPARSMLSGSGGAGDGVMWPRIEGGHPLLALRHGAVHHYAPLAICAYNAAAGTWTMLSDCHQTFPPLTEVSTAEPDSGTASESCCSVTVRDVGELVHALHGLQSGQRLCLLPGTYVLKESIAIYKENVTVVGCGHQAQVVAPPNRPAFILGAKGVRLESLSVRALFPSPAISIRGEDVRVEDCLVHCDQPERPAASGGGAAGTTVSTGNADAVLVPTALRRTRGRAAVPRSRYLVERRPAEIEPRLAVALSAASQVVLENNRLRGGGIWVGEGSSEVLIRGNQIGSGTGAGVILGGIPGDGKLPKDAAGVVGIRIEDNTILDMENSGISTSAQIDENRELGELADLIIARNRIEGCARKGPHAEFDKLVVGGIVLRHVVGLRIHDNHIADNGAAARVPACGVFVVDAQDVEITNNRLANNGALAKEGFQAGIAALYVEPEEAAGGDLENCGQLAGAPAARVHDNVVVCPQGAALMLLGHGAMSVRGNALSTQVIGHFEAKHQLVGEGSVLLPVAPSCVSIRNFGIAPDRCEEFQGNRELVTHPGSLLPGDAVQIGGRVQFSGNQVTLGNGATPQEGPQRAQVCAILVSFDDLAVTDNQFLVTGVRVHANLYANANTVRVAGNRFTESRCKTLASCISKGEKMNFTVENQATHPVYADDAPAFADNQFSVLGEECTSEWTKVLEALRA